MAIRVTVVIVFELSVGVVGSRRKAYTHRCQTATAIDISKHRTVRDVDSDIAAHTTGCQSRTRVTAATTKDVTIHVGGTRASNLQLFAIGREGLTTVAGITIAIEVDFYDATDVGHGVRYDVTVLTSTECGAEDAGCARDVHFGLYDIGPCVEEDALVTLTCSEEVTGHGMLNHALKNARCTERTTHHVNRTLTSCYRYCRFTIAIIRIYTHVGYFVAAIEAGHDVTSSDVNLRITTYETCLAVPLTRLVRVFTRATSIHVAVIGVTVGTSRTTSLC